MFAVRLTWQVLILYFSWFTSCIASASTGSHSSICEGGPMNWECNDWYRISLDTKKRFTHQSWPNTSLSNCSLCHTSNIILPGKPKDHIARWSQVHSTCQLVGGKFNFLIVSTCCFGSGVLQGWSIVLLVFSLVPKRWSREFQRKPVNPMQQCPTRRKMEQSVEPKRGSRNRKLSRRLASSLFELHGSGCPNPQGMAISLFPAFIHISHTCISHYHIY